MYPQSVDPQPLATIQRHAHPLDAQGALAPLFELLARRRFVLLGEASHGTHEFYLHRAEITRTLIESHQCRAVVVEGDWPDAYRVNRWVRGLDDDAQADDDPLGDFERFPTWMWRNTVVREFVHWLREHNRAQPPWLRVGFYGMDLYSLHASARAVLAYLEDVDAEAARRARLRYGCFDHFEQDLQAYGYAAGFGVGSSCEDGVVAQLQELLRTRQSAMTTDGDPDALFHAQQNARLVHSAEQYYRSMFNGRSSSWNLRDLHMVDTLMALSAHLQERTGEPPRIAVWAHNSHLGDASATAMGTQGEWNVGDLLRRRCPGETALVGFTTYGGSVRAASRWDEPGEVIAVRPGLPGSWEALFHETQLERFLLLPHEDPALREALSQPLLERAIGVIYLPQTERRSHYFTARLGDQFDAVIHIDQTRAVQPLDDRDAMASTTASQDRADTYPSGL